MSIKLTQYDFPNDLKEMDIDDMELLSYAIRDFLVDKISKTGGHVASNLGVVELTIGLHKVFDSPKDKIIWDVGHQSYVHKILTGRADLFDGLRQFNGMSGFPKAKESPHDVYDTGHSSTSISAAAGMAAARDIKGEDYEIVAVIGDGSLTGGLAFEGLNNLGASKSRAIVVLNDNGMSISKNIGGLSQHLTNLRTSDKYISAKKNLKKTLKNIPMVGDRIYDNLNVAKDKLKYAIISGGVLFESLGFTYIGPIDGHNMKDVVDALEQAKHVSGPVLVHMITKKGKGYINAEKYPSKFHGVSPFDPETGNPLKKSGLSYSKVFGDAAVKLADEDENVVAITAAMGEATGLGEFTKKYPKRFFDVGIAEGHAVTFAAGLAKSGMRPIVAIYSSFLQRAYDQLIEDICIQNLPVIFAIDRAGIVGADGETHHGVFDIAYLKSLPNMTVLTPSSGNELAAMMEYAKTVNGPVAIRYPRGECKFDINDNTNYVNQNKRLYSGKDVDIWACGRMVDTAVAVREQLLSKNIEAGIVSVTTVKPLDISPMENKVLPVVTLEDGIAAGGFGESLKALSNAESVTVMGWPDKFIEHGDCSSLEKKYGLDADSIAERIGEIIERKA